MRRILVTSALPYANGPLHFGHILEAVQTDIWARAMRLSGHQCHYVCADDTHGTPIMLKAQSEGVTPEQLIAGIEAEHRATYRDFLIDHAWFHSTHSVENKRCTEEIFKALDAAGYIARRTIRQAYDESAGMFLPDRYVKGICPRCDAADQYGDSCEVCGATYSPSDLKSPISVISGTTPVERDSEHLFFKLDAFGPMLKEWTRSGAIHESVANKLEEWFSAGLRDWDISRDAPYFGFEIPGHAGKYFYVWLDAPVGYMAASLALAEHAGLDFKAWWSADSSAELHHFIGKDILYFHTLFWPAVLQGAGYRRPTQVHAHGFLTVNGQKMSKSRGTFITGRRYLDRLPPEPLRYYFAAKLGPGIDDMDLSLDDFVSRFNADVVGKVVNIASRCAGFIARGGGVLASTLPDPQLYADFASAAERIAGLYESRDFVTAIREIATLADRANQYIDAKKPWNLAKDPSQGAEVLAVCTQGINLFRVLMTYLAPVLPLMAERAGEFLGRPISHWNDVAQPLTGTALAPYAPLATRLDPKVVATLIEDTPAAPSAPSLADTPAPAKSQTAAAAPAPSSTPKVEATKGEVTIDDFMKLDLRVGKVLECSLVDGSDKLLRLQIDLGNGDVRQIFSGIRESYTPESMVGRQVVVIANLKPRKMRFGVSQGMVLCASNDGPGVFLVSPDEGAVPGMTVT